MLVFPGNMIPSIKARVVTQVACSRRSDSRFLYFVHFRMSLQSVLSSSELSVHPSSCCRFCGKNVKSSGNKTPRVSLFNVVTNKDLVGFSGKESLVLADIASSLGYELKKEEHLSDVPSLLFFSRSFLLRTAPHYLNAWNRLIHKAKAYKFIS